MVKKNVQFWAAGIILTTVVLLWFNAQAYEIGEDTRYAVQSDKSDRTILKEILLNQEETLALLKDIKAMLQAGK